MSSTSKARITIFQLPTSPEFAKRVNLYADPEPCIKTFRRADFLSFIMIHQKLLLRYSLLPILDEKPRRNFQHRSPNKKGSPILERSSSREEQTLLSSPLLQTLASTLRTSRAATNVKMKIAIMFRGEEEGHRHRGVQGSEQVVVIKLDGVCREKREADDEKSVAQSTIFDQHSKTASLRIARLAFSCLGNWRDEKETTWRGSWEVGKFRRIWICMESVGTPRTGYRIMRLRSRSF